jgi:UDP-N-acetylmuramyl pentapeptide synthase
MQYEEVGGVHFYNDAYNANPASAKAGFETMAEIDTSARKILIFADMLELGAQSIESHINAAAQMLSAGFDYIILLGMEVFNSAQYLKEQGFKDFSHNTDKAQSLQHFLNEVKPGDLVYLKGSRGMQLEDFVNAYKENQ